MVRKQRNLSLGLTVTDDCRCCEYSPLLMLPKCQGFKVMLLKHHRSAKICVNWEDNHYASGAQAVWLCWNYIIWCPSNLSHDLIHWKTPYHVFMLWVHDNCLSCSRQWFVKWLFLFPNHSKFCKLVSTNYKWFRNNLGLGTGSITGLSLPWQLAGGR